GLPDLDGIVVAQRIRARQDAAAGVLLVAISGHGADSDLEATRAAGFDAHLVKPVAPERILDLLAGRQLIPGPRERARRLLRVPGTNRRDQRPCLRPPGRPSSSTTRICESRS